MGCDGEVGRKGPVPCGERGVFAPMTARIHPRP